MRNFLRVMILVVFAAGCARTDVPTVVALDNSVSSAPEHSVESTKPITYPEKTEVDRLLVRAGEHQQQGEFDKALTLVKEAIQVDPNSPSATAMRTTLEDILRKS